MFDPTLYNFTSSVEVQKVGHMKVSSDTLYWYTIPPDLKNGKYEYIIGNYEIEYNETDDWWYIKQIIIWNSTDREHILYSGRIPDNNFGFQLLKNMELDLPVIQREIKVDTIIS